MLAYWHQDSCTTKCPGPAMSWLHRAVHADTPSQSQSKTDGTKRKLLLRHEGCNAPQEDSWETDLHHPHLSCPLGFWFNKDGTCPVFMAKHNNTRSIRQSPCRPFRTKTRRSAFRWCLLFLVFGSRGSCAELLLRHSSLIQHRASSFQRPLQPPLHIAFVMV